MAGPGICYQPRKEYDFPDDEADRFINAMIAVAVDEPADDKPKAKPEKVAGDKPKAPVVADKVKPAVVADKVASPVKLTK